MVVKERTKLCNNICEMSRVPEAQWAGHHQTDSKKRDLK